MAQAAPSNDFDFFAPVGKPLKSSDFFSCHDIGASTSRPKAASSKSPLFSEHWRYAAHPIGAEAVRPQDGLGLVGGLTAWCQGVVDQLERAVPSTAKQQDMLVSGIRSLPNFGACVPRVKLAQVAIAASSSHDAQRKKDPRLKTTVSLAKAAARRRTCRRDSGLAGEATGEEDDSHRVEALALVLAPKRLREVSWTISNHAVLGLTRLFGSGAQSMELRATTCGLLASVLAPLSSGGSALALSGTGGPAMAFCPIDFGCFGNGSLTKCVPMRELTLQELEKGVLVATFVQGSLGLFRICLGDVFSGCYSLLLATLGYNSRRPGPASNWLKTYVLITFINGTMSGIDLMQNCLLQNYPVVLPGVLPLAVNMAHVVQLLVPWVSFLGAYCGWQHIKMQRKAVIQAYQDQMAMLMEQPPWPPPPLPFPLPGMPGIQMVEDDGEYMQMPPGFQGFPPNMPGMPGNFGRLPSVQEMPEEESEAPAKVGGSSSRESKQNED